MPQDRTIFAGVIALGLIVLASMGFFIFEIQTDEARRSGTSFLILGSAMIAWASLLANIWLNRRQSRSQQTLEFLRTIRLDADYLRFASDFRDIARVQGQVLPPDAVSILTRARTASFNESEMKFRMAASFLLNFYEMVAVAAYRQDLDWDLLRRTSRGNIVRLVITCSPWIKHLRDAPGGAKSLEHLVWFYRRFAVREDLPVNLQAELHEARQLDLGPDPKL